MEWHPHVCRKGGSRASCAFYGPPVIYVREYLEKTSLPHVVLSVSTRHLKPRNCERPVVFEIFLFISNSQCIGGNKPLEHFFCSYNLVIQTISCSGKISIDLARPTLSHFYSKNIQAYEFLGHFVPGKVRHIRPKETKKITSVLSFRPRERMYILNQNFRVFFSFFFSTSR